LYITSNELVKSDEPNVDVFQSVLVNKWLELA